MMWEYGFNHFVGPALWVSFIFKAVLGLLLLALLVIAIVALVRRANGHRPAGGEKPTDPSVGSALNILNERYARGEISDEEYRAKKDQLMR